MASYEQDTPRRWESAGEYITKKEAEVLKACYRENFKDQEVQSIFFGRNKILALLEQKGCQGLRIYFGATINSPAELDLVLVGGDDKGGDIDERDLYLDRGVKCPPHCQ